MGSLVLVVEDSDDIREAVAAALTDDGYRVVAVPNAIEALTLLRAELRPTVILSDCRMPGMSGPEFCEVLAQSPSLSKIPIVLMSAELHPSETKRPILRKPLKMKPLLEALSRAIES